MGDRGHGLRLAADDLYDCGWNITQRYTVPSDLLPGLYSARIEFGAGRRYDSVFIVKRPASRPAARVAVLCSTNTWLAYGVPFAQNPDANEGWGLGGARISYPNTPAYNFYNRHAGGQAPYKVGINLPWPAAHPYAKYFTQHDSNYGHLTRAERHLHVWLERNGYDYDAFADHDLDADPALLNDYQVLFIAGHSEYWSARAYDHVQQFLGRGGRLVVVSGNTMFWRVSIEDGVVECRKLPIGVGGFSNNLAGELYHEHDQRRGGLMREAEHPAWRCIGLECVGYSGPMMDYRVTQASHPFFRSPEDVPVGHNSVLGAGAVGHEWDVRRASLPAPFRPAAENPEPVAIAEARASTVDRTYFDYRANNRAGGTAVTSEIVDWIRSDGGRVLAAGSIAAPRAMNLDRNVSATFRNALHHFGLTFRLNVAAQSTAGTVQHKWFSNGWGPSASGWESHGNQVLGRPTGIAWAPNRLSLMAVNASGRLAYKWSGGANWSPSVSAWSDLGGSLHGQPAPVAWGRNRMDIFARSSSQTVHVKSWDGAAWRPSYSGWTDLGGAVASDPHAVAWHANRVSVAAVHADGRLAYRWRIGDVWNSGGWQNLGGANLQHRPTLVAWGGHRLNIFVVDRYGRLYNKWWDGQAWGPSTTGWQYLGAGLSGRVEVAVREGNELSVFGIGTDGRLKAKWWDGQAWGPSLTGLQDLGGELIGEPAVATWRGRHVSVMAVTVAGTLGHRLWDGQSWQPWEDLGGSLAPTPFVFGWLAS